jgi:hypothetical protein
VLGDADQQDRSAAAVAPIGSERTDDEAIPPVRGIDI